MSYTFYSPIVQESIAYDLGYKSGFNQVGSDCQYSAGVLQDNYYKGRRDGIDDYFETATRTGVL